MDLTADEILLISKIAQWILENIDLTKDQKAMFTEIVGKSFDQWCAR